MKHDQIINDIKKIVEDNQQMRLFLTEAVINAQSVVHNMADLNKRTGGKGFCTKDEEVFAKKVSKFLVHNTKTSANR